MLITYLRELFYKLKYGDYAKIHLEIYETSVGIKYKLPNMRFNPFTDYIHEKIRFTDIGVSFDDFLLSPDLLKDSHTVCGKTIMASPHYRLFEEIENKTINKYSDYICRVQIGILDARMARSISLVEILKKYESRKKSFFNGRELEVMVVEIKEGNEKKYVVLDGKHRLAFAAFHKMQDVVSLVIINNDYTKNTIINRLYNYIIDNNTDNYKINQRMIKLITYGS
jgi:hypothetical protein